MRRARQLHIARPRQHPRQPQPRRRVGGRPVGGAVHDQHRTADLGDVWGEVGHPEGIDASRRRQRARLQRDPPVPVQHRLAHRAAERADAVEELEETLQEGGPVLDDALLDLVDHLRRRPVGVVLALQEPRHDRGQERHPLHPLAGVAGHAAGDLSAAHRKADQRGAVQFQRVHDRGKVVGQRVIVITAQRLVRPAKAAPVIAHHPIARLDQRAGLMFPRIRRQRPAVDQDDGPALAPVLGVNPHAVVGFDPGHGMLRSACDCRSRT